MKRLAAVLLACLCALPGCEATRPGDGAAGRADGTMIMSDLNSVRLIFAGDVMLDDGPGRTVAAGGDPLVAFDAVPRDADYAVANLECPISTAGRAVANKPFTFRAHPRVLGALKGRFNAVSVANNHSGDYGHEAFTQTLEHLQSAGIAAFGGGRNLREAHAPLWIERNGLRIAVLGYNEFLPRSFEAGPNWPGVAWSEDHDSPRNSNRRLRSRYAGKEPPTFDQAAACGLSRRSRSKGRMRPILLKNSIAHRPRCLRRKSTSQNRAGDANDEWLRDQ